MILASLSRLKKTFFGEAGRRSRAQGPMRFARPQLERLEGREVLSVSAPLFTVNAVSGTQANVAWSSVSGASNYLVDQYINGAWVQIAKLGSGSTSYAVTGLKPGTTYYFDVAAANSSGSTWATYKAVTTRPAAPSFTVNAVSGTQVNLAWSSVSGASNYLVDQYINGAWVQIAKLGSGSTSYAVTGLKPSTTYYFDVAAANSSGSTWATYKAVTTRPAAPSFTVNAVSGTQVNLAWSSVSGASKYLVDQYINGAWVQIANLGSGSTSYAVTGLKPGTTYYFDVAAANSSGSTWATYKVVTTQAAAPTMAQQIVNFCNAEKGQKVGGGECAQLVSEALRVAGANFLTSDPTGTGDYVWGNLVTVLTAQNGQITNSNPSNAVQVGDILQFQNVTLSNGASYPHHTAIVASVNASGQPTAIYEQNTTVNGVAAHYVTLDSINLTTMLSGTVHIYRAVPRQDAVGKVQFSVVNNTNLAKSVTISFNGQAVQTLSLSSFNTAGSYMNAWEQRSADGVWTISIGGQSVALKNAGGYEVFTTADGQVSIRQI